MTVMIPAVKFPYRNFFPPYSFDFLLCQKKVMIFLDLVHIFLRYNHKPFLYFIGKLCSTPKVAHNFNEKCFYL